MENPQLRTRGVEDGLLTPSIKYKQQPYSNVLHYKRCNRMRTVKIGVCVFVPHKRGICALFFAPPLRSAHSPAQVWRLLKHHYCSRPALQLFSPQFNYPSPVRAAKSPFLP